MKYPPTKTAIALLVAGILPCAHAQRQMRPAVTPAAQHSGPAVPTQAQAQTQMQTATRSRGVTAPRNTKQWHMQRRAAATGMVRYEHNYRLQLARIDRVQQIYRQQGRLDRVKQLDQIRDRLQDQYRDRGEDCRQALGDQDYLRLKDRIKAHTNLRDGDRIRDRDRLRDPDSDPDRLRDPDRDRLRSSDPDRDRDRSRDPIKDPGLDRDRDRIQDKTSKPDNQ